MSQTKGMIDRLMRLHYRLMARPRFWYEPAWINRSRKLCVAASNLRAFDVLHALQEQAERAAGVDPAFYGAKR